MGLERPPSPGGLFSKLFLPNIFICSDYLQTSNIFSQVSTMSLAI